MPMKSRTKATTSKRRLKVVVWLIVSCALTQGSSVVAATTLVRVGDAIVRPDRLVAGAHRYLRYQVKDGHRTAIDIWNRTVTFETIDGKRLLHITQRWDEANPTKAGAIALDQDSSFDSTTFRPITHVRRATKLDGTITVAGYRFFPERVIGMQRLPGNSKQDFSLAYSESPFNFEYDMELLQALPLTRGLDVSLPFYDAGIDAKSDRYRFQIVGSARIVGWDGTPVNCWLVTADYNSGIVKSRFWFDKKKHVLIREEQPLDDGGTQVKTLLPPEASDVT